MKTYALPPRILQTFAWPLARLVLFCFSSFQVEGLEHLREAKGPFVIASNHFNELDPILIRAALPWLSKPTFWVGRRKKWYDGLPEHERFRGVQKYLYSDLLFTSFGNVPAPHGQHDYAKTLGRHAEVLEDGFSVIIYPMAGVEKHVGWEAPARGGVSYLAAASGRPILPIGINGSHRVHARKLFLGRPRFRVVIGRPIPAPERDADHKLVAQELKERIRRLAMPDTPPPAGAPTPVPQLAEERK